MTEEGSMGPNDYVYDLAMFLLASARGCLDEPPHYGPLRLMQALSRLATASRQVPCINADEFLLAAKKKIDENEHVAFQSEEEFTKFLDSMIREFTVELKLRNKSK